MRPGRAALALALALAGGAGPAPGQTPALTLAPCRLDGMEEPARCGTWTVPEDRANPGGRRIGLRVVVLPATGPARRTDPLAVLAGGPGESAVAMAAAVALWFADLRRERDILLVDQRGTGRSNPLQCHLPGPAAAVRAVLVFEFGADALAACVDSLSRHADLRHYTTPAAMDDLDEVRAALGYDRLNLYGGSYGTRAAFVYLRRHPRRVRSAVLRAIAPVDMRALLPAARHAQAAFDGLVRDCRADSACARAWPDPAGQLAAVLAGLAARPATVPVPLPGGGSAPLTVDRELFAGALPFLMASPEGAALVPWLVARAAGGDLAPFAAAVAPIGAGYASFLSLGMTLAVLCGEDARGIAEDAIGPATAGTFLGAARVRNQLGVCARWPAGAVEAPYFAPVRSEAPVLMISGELDPIDGLDLAQGAAAHLPNATHVVIPSGTHQPQFPGCLADLARRFVLAASARGLDTACVAGIRRPPFRLP
jgi:pimeloyl-ACP methyl ester carboxylesterase